jgi:TonB family protein
MAPAGNRAARLLFALLLAVVRPPAMADSSLPDLARLVLTPGDPRIVPVLREGLSSPDPLVRGTAARVTAVLRLGPLFDDLLAAIERETDLGAFREEAFAAASLDSERGVPAVLAAAGRLGPAGRGIAAQPLARALGPEALSLYVAELRPGITEPMTAAAFFLWATRDDPVLLSEVAKSALDRRDAVSWEGVLRTFTELNREPDEALLRSGLGSDKSVLVSSTARYLVAALASGGDVSKARSAFGASISTARGRLSDIDRFFVDLLARKLGATALVDEELLGAWRGGKAVLPKLPTGSDGLLTSEEKKAMEAGLARLHPDRSAFRPAADDFARRPVKRGKDGSLSGRREDFASLLATASDLPPGLATSVLGSSPCPVADDSYLAAKVSFREDGRSLKASVVFSPSGSCDAAVAPLLALVQASDFDPPFLEPYPFLVLPTGQSFRRTSDERIGAGDWEPRYLPQGGLVEPEEMFRARPLYPVEMRRARVQGEVLLRGIVGTSGSVRALRLIRGSGVFDSRGYPLQSLELASLVAVMQWKYKPARQEGRPVPTWLDARITFTLR